MYHSITQLLGHTLKNEALTSKNELTALLTTLKTLYNSFNVSLPHYNNNNALVSEHPLDLLLSLASLGYYSLNTYEKHSKPLAIKNDINDQAPCLPNSFIPLNLQHLTKKLATIWINRSSVANSKGQNILC